MSEQQPKKPKDIKDLKARLGRTVAPNTELRSPFAQGTPASIPAPAAPGAAPVPGGPIPAPFGAPAAQPAKPAGPVDPFAVAAPAAAPVREVRLVFDDKAIDDAEIGRKKKGTLWIVGGIVGVIAAVIGFTAGSVRDRRMLHNAAIRDAKDVYTSVQAAAAAVEQASQLLRRADTASETRPGQPPRIDYDAIRQLSAIQNPFRPEQFSGKRYGAFGAAAVSDLFSYYNNLMLLWERFRTIRGRTDGTNARAALDASAQAAGTLTTQQYGLVFRTQNDAWRGALVYVDPPTPPAAGAEPAEGAPEIRGVRQTPTSAPVQRTVYAGQPLSGSEADYVLLIDTALSVGILGQAAQIFAEVRRLIHETMEMLRRLQETQGRLLNALATTANEPEVVVF